MSAFDTHAESLDDESQTLRSQRLWKSAGQQDLDFDSQRLRNRLRAKMFGVDASPVKIGRFAVLETVGSGGMGVVYAVYDEELDRRVAVKLLRNGRDEDGSVGKARIQREAQALAKLSHPNVVQVYEVGTFDGRVFLAMEFLAGPDLRSWLLEESRPWQDVLQHFIEAGSGLAAAHREGIIHRDFKPANILFGGDGRVRVVDFGLARASEHARVPQSLPSGELKEHAFAIELTQTGEIMGTPAYMSPEQARYEGVDARSDQYSFCVALYEALFGRRPHVGSSTAEVLVAVAEGRVAAPPRNTKVPARVVRAIMRGLRTEPAERFPTMEALLAELSFEEKGRWRWLGGGAVVVAGLGVWMSMGPAECPSFESALAEDWGPSRRAAVEAAFVASETPRAQEVAQLVGGRLDAYAEQWLHARRDACEAHQVRHEQSAQLHDQRVACLLERQVELGTLVTVFTQADADTAAQAPRAVAELSSVAECQDFERMSAAAAGAPVRQELRAGLAEARAQYKAGLYQRALSGVDAVAEAARADGAQGVVAAALLQRGLIEERRRAFQPAAEAVEQALDLAELVGDDELAARAWSRMARYQARLGDVALADHGVRRAWAKVHRLGDEPELLLEVRESQALAAWQAGRHEEAIEEQIQLVEEYRKQKGEDDPRTADAERRLGNMLSDQGRHDEAQARYARARQVLARAYGPGHPMVAHVVVDAAIDHRAAGRRDEAREAFLAAERLFVAAQGPEAPALLTVHKVLTEFALQDHQLDEAQRHVERLLVLSQGPGASPADRSDALALEGQVAALRGDHERAVEVYREYLDLAGSGRLASTYRVHRIATRIELGEQLLVLGRPEDVEPELQRALAELDDLRSDATEGTSEANLRASAWRLLGECARARGESPVEHYERALQSWSGDAPIDAEGQATQAKLQWALARQLARTDPVRAHELAAAARPRLDEAEQARLDAWLAARPAPHGT